jgi:Glycosyl transferase family 2
MKLAMTLLLRDNADILEANLRYHLARGVDLILATDNGSSDGTVEILERYRDRGVAEIWHENSTEFDQGAWVTRMAREAATEHGADWVINNDADELWWPKQGDLKEVFERIPGQFGRLVVWRTNFVARPEDDLHPFERMTLRETRSFNPRGGRIQPKTAHRGSPDVTVSLGCHDAWGPGLVTVPDSNPIHIFHYSFRSFEQFEQRIRNAAEIMEGDPEGESSATMAWRLGYKHLREGTLREFYESKVVDDATARSRIAAGELVLDRRAATFLRANGLLDQDQAGSVSERSRTI